MAQRQPTPFWTQAVAERVRELRDKRRLSAQALADRCEQLGWPTLDRTVIANLENGRRRSITIDELMVLALALDVALVHLLVPFDDDAEVEIAPALGAVPAVNVRAWIRGDESIGDEHGDHIAYHSTVPPSEWQPPPPRERPERRPGRIEELPMRRHRGEGSDAS